MQPTRIRGRVLVIAGSDSGGGAGIQADIKTVTALGGYAATAVTAVTVQNTEGVQGIHVVPTSTVVAQINAVLADIGADVIKTGMLASGELIDTVYSVLRRTAPDTPLVVDPVMVAKGGAPLVDKDAVHAMKGRLIPRATVITPNLPEAETLLGRKIGDVQEMREAVEALRDLGSRGILLKGGHLPGDDLVDIYAGPEGTQEWSATRIDTPHTHGTGCTLASAIATGLAQGLDMIDSIARARAYVRRAIETAPGLGRGHGPLNHAHTVRPFTEE